MLAIVLSLALAQARPAPEPMVEAVTHEHGVTDPTEIARHPAVAVLKRQALAWSRGDIDAFCAVYAEDALFVTPSGLTRGREAVRSRYKAKYPDAAAMGTLTLEPVDLRNGGDTVAVAAKWTLTYPDKPAATGWTLIVLHEVAGRWLVMQDASM
jgi:uncharacterized protein (TIGR02246 family)